MIRTGDEYRESIRDGREVWINGERVGDVPSHPMFRPVVDIRARIYDMAHDPATRDVMTVVDQTGERFAVGPQLPLTKEDWWAKRRAVDAVMDDIGGVVTRVGDETVGEMWSLYDGQDVLNEIDPRFSQNIRHHVEYAARCDPFHVSANTDPKGDRSKRPQEQDPDMLLHVVKETDAGIIVRGAKFETAAAYANQAFVKPTIANWGDSELSDYAVGFIAHMGAPGMKHICRTGFATRAPREDYPLSNRFDEVDTLIVFDDVHIPWEDVLFYRHTRAAAYIRATLHRYSAFAFVQRILRYADMMLGTAMYNARQTGLEKQQAVQEKLATLAVYREGINAHLTAAIAEAEVSPGGLLMPNQSLLYTGRVHACASLAEMMHLTRDLCGGQICVTPDFAAFAGAETGPWLEKFYTINERWQAEDRRKLLAYARDLLNSDYAGHRLTFQLFAQSPPFAHLLAVYRNFDFSEPMRIVRESAGLSERVEGDLALRASGGDGFALGGDAALRGSRPNGLRQEDDGRLSPPSSLLSEATPPEIAQRSSSPKAKPAPPKQSDTPS
jgi:4-hydroxyphenylacetate 3-monooxygenase